MTVLKFVIHLLRLHTFSQPLFLSLCLQKTFFPLAANLLSSLLIFKTYFILYLLYWIWPNPEIGELRAAARGKNRENNGKILIQTPCNYAMTLWYTLSFLFTRVVYRCHVNQSQAINLREKPFRSYLRKLMLLERLEPLCSLLKPFPVFSTYGALV